MTDKVSKNMIGVAGEYYVCTELCRRNILALVTPKNNPLFDIVAVDPMGRRTVSMAILSQPRKRSVVQISESRPGRFASICRLPN
jgi:hypothetical protein